MKYFIPILAVGAGVLIFIFRCNTPKPDRGTACRMIQAEMWCKNYDHAVLYAQLACINGAEKYMFRKSDSVWYWNDMYELLKEHPCQ